MAFSDLEGSNDRTTENLTEEHGHTALKMDEPLEKSTRVFDIMQHSQSTRKSILDPESPPTVTYPVRLFNPIIPSSSIPFPKDFNQNPYLEVGYTPQRFRPEDYEKALSSDDELIASVVSSPTTWLPPEHPDELLEGEDVPISPTAYSPSANDYTGAVLHPGQLSSITTYGFPGGAFHSPKRTKSTADASKILLSPQNFRQRQPTVVASSDEKPELENLFNSPDSSSAGTWTSSGAPLTQLDQGLSTFAIRAKQAGISDWDEKITKGLRGNDRIFDGRWVLNPSEAWNVPARRISSFTRSLHDECRNGKSSRCPAAEPAAFSNTKTDNTAMLSDEDMHRCSNYKGDQMYAETQDSEKRQPQSDETQRQNVQRLDKMKSLNESEESKKDRQTAVEINNEPEAKESLRLEQYVTDLSLANDGLQSKLESYDPASILRVFYLRVFDNSDPQIPCGEDAEKLVKHKGKIVTNRDLYLSLFRDIQDLVAYMTSPVGLNTLHSLAPGPDAVADRHHRSTQLYQSDNTQDTIRSESDSSKTKILGQQLQSRSQHQSPSHHTQEEASSAKDYQFTERLRNLAKAIELRSTNPRHIYTDPSSTCNITTGDIIGTTNAQSRLQPRFGDPATADFNPAFDRVGFSLKQNMLPSIPKLHSSVESSAPFPYPDSSVHRNTSLLNRGPGNQLSVYHPRLTGSINFDTSTTQRSNALHSNIVTTTKAPPDDNPGAPIVGPVYAPFQDAPISGTHDQRSGIQFHPNDQQGHQSYGSSQESSLPGSMLDMHIPVSHSQAFPQSHVQSEAWLLPQAQAPTQIAPQNQYHAELLSQSQSFPNQVFPLDAQNYPLNIAGQQSGGQVLGYNSLHHQMAILPHTIGSQGHGNQISYYTAPKQTAAGQYQYGLRQSLHPYHPQRPFGDYHSSEILTGTVAGQPYLQTPTLGFQTPSHYGAASGSTAQSYVQPYIPADKYARAPAPNRIASRIAQTSAFQTIQPKLPVNSSLIQTRYPTPNQNSRTNIATLPYRAVSDSMYPALIPGVASIRFQDLTRDEPPRSAVAGDENYIPFVETTSLSSPAEWGVLRVSNMPYDITRELILAFLGTHAKTITPDLGPCIHIMMDRSTGKTQDCYVEFFSVPDARAWHTVIARRGSSLNKIGDRILEVDLSSQEELMKELFPRAHCVIWNGNNGVQVKETEEAFDSGFKGFITQEELKGLIHHAEQPHRSLYTQKCPSRPYTNLISILAKFPWHASQHYTLSTRNILYNATLTLIKSLASFLRRSSSTISSQGHRLHNSNTSHDSNASTTVSLFRPDLSASELSRLEMREKGLNESLLKEMVLAGMNAYGFSERQRWEIYLAAAGVLGQQWMRLSPLMSRWPWEVVGRKSGYEEDVVEFYAHLLSSHPPLSFPGAPFRDNANPHDAFETYSQALVQNEAALMPFGRFDADLYDSAVEGYKTGTVTIAELGKWEIAVINSVIRAECVRDERRR